MVNLRSLPILLVALPSTTLVPGPRFPATNQLIGHHMRERLVRGNESSRRFSASESTTQQPAPGQSRPPESAQPQQGESKQTVAQPAPSPNPSAQRPHAETLLRLAGAGSGSCRRAAEPSVKTDARP